MRWVGHRATPALVHVRCEFDPTRCLIGESNSESCARDDSFGEAVGSETVGTVNPGTGNLADGEQTRQIGLTVEVGGYAAAAVVGGRSDRNAISGWVDAERPAR